MALCLHYLLYIILQQRLAQWPRDWRLLADAWPNGQGVGDCWLFALLCRWWLFLVDCGLIELERGRKHQIVVALSECMLYGAYSRGQEGECDTKKEALPRTGLRGARGTWTR